MSYAIIDKVVDRFGELVRRTLYRAPKNGVLWNLSQELTSPAPINQNDSKIDAGLTYIGQMISHDIVPPTTTNPMSRTKVPPYLCLQSLYGEEKERLKPFVIRELPNQNFDLRLGLDLERTNGVAQIPDPRNDENLIISQLCTVWQKLHNLLLLDNEGSSHSAHATTVLAFQLVVIEDFLYNVLDEEVFTAYFNHQHTSFYPNLATDTIPDFFRYAAFRFGHSMVRQFYRFQPSPVPDVLLGEMFNNKKELSAKHVIDWSKLFNTASQKALLIDTHITPIMREVEFITASPISDIDVVMKNLEAGVKNKLRTGIEEVNRICKHNAGNPIFEQIKLEPLSCLDSRFIDCGFQDISEFPLWPYILLEAERSKSKGKKLGTLGSLLVAETIRNSILGSNYSVFNEEGTYSFTEVVKSMGTFGKHLTNNVSQSGRNTSMTNVLKAIKNMEKQND